MFDYIVIYLLPLVYIILGLIFWMKPPKKRNQDVGWRTKRAFESHEAWIFANSYGGKNFFCLGLMEAVLTLLLHIFLTQVSESIRGFLALGIIMLQTFGIAIIFHNVEKELERLFGHEGGKTDGTNH